MALELLVRVINLPLIQHVELAGRKKNADEGRQKPGIDKKEEDVGCSETLLVSLTADRCFD